MGSLSAEPGKLQVQVYPTGSAGFNDHGVGQFRSAGAAGFTKGPGSSTSLGSPSSSTPKQRAPVSKHASMLSIGKPMAPGVVPTPWLGASGNAQPRSPGGNVQISQAVLAQLAGEALPNHTHHEKKSVSRSISTYFKGLFKKTSSDGMPSSPSRDDSKNSSFSLKAVFSSLSPDALLHQEASPRANTIAPTREALTVQTSAKSSTAALEGEVAAAMRRAQSITGRQHAPSTLLSVSRDLPPKMQRANWSLKDYAVVEKMYTGYASNVYKAFCKLSGETVCLKSYSLGNLCELNRFQIFREVKLHSSLSHEHIIKLYGAFQQADQVVLVQEYADAGDLFNLLQRYGGRLPERTAVELVLYPFLCVINYLHTNGIAHRDIKPENILFTSDMRLKLCDFGLAINMREERAVTRAGTLEYMAPEVLNCPFKNKPEENKEILHLQYSFHVDTWAAGVLTYELLVGIPPFSDKQRNMVEDKIRLEVPRFPNKISELAKDFITRALEKDPLERPTIMDMVNHRWIKTLRRSASVRQLPVGSPRQPVAPLPSGGSGPLAAGHAMAGIHESEELTTPGSTSSYASALPGSSLASPLPGSMMTLPSPASSDNSRNAPKKTVSFYSQAQKAQAGQLMQHPAQQ